MLKVQYIPILLVICLFFTEIANAQHFNPKNRYEAVGVNVNAMNYVGEVDPSPGVISPGLAFTRYNVGVSFIQKYNPRIFFRGNISYGRIKGDDYENASYEPQDIHRKIRNLSFRNQILEVKVDAIFDLFEHYQTYWKRPDYTPYFFAGLAYFYHNPEALTPQGNWVKLKPLSTEGQGLSGTNKKPYSLHQIAIPVGVGFKYKLGKNWDLAFEIGWRFTLTDYLDDVSGVYTDRDLLRQEKGELAVTMSDRTWEALQRDPALYDFALNRQGFVNKDNSPYNGSGYGYLNSWTIPGGQRGDPNKDWYIVTGFHLIYIFPPRVICPKFRK